MDELIKLESFRGTSFFSTFMMFKVLTKTEMKQVVGEKLSEAISVISNDDTETIILKRGEWEKLCSSSINQLLEQKSFGKIVEKNIKNKCLELKRFTNKLTQQKIVALTNEEITLLLDEYYKKTEELRLWAWIPNLLNFSKNNLSVITKKNLEKTKIPKSKFEEVFTKLSTPTKDMVYNKANISLLELIKELKKNNNSSTFKKEINEIKKELDERSIIKMQKYLKKYSFLTYYYKGPEMSIDDLILSIKEKINTNIEQKKKQLNENNKTIIKEQKQLIKKYGLTKKELCLIEEVKRMTFLKAYRKEYLTYLNYKIRIVQDEIAKRLGTNIEIVRNMLPDEIRHYLLKNKKVKNQFNKRLKELITIHSDNKIKIKINKKRLEQIKELFDNEGLSNETYKTEIKGQMAYPGYARGIVKILEFRNEMKKFNKGDILVSRSTNPEIVLAMEKSAAIVTDVGGITCHASIVARELKIPCLIGTKNASKVLKDGDYVEVDVNRGFLRKLR